MKKITILIWITFMAISAYAQPKIGAQVWIEPGNTDEQINAWFKILAEQEMPVARMFIMWNYIETKSGKWDFTLYDKAFDAAAKYGVKVVATLTTNRRPPHRGDFYQLHATVLEDTKERLEESKVYIKKIVEHWQNHPALEYWMLTNEANQFPHEQPLAMERYRIWLKEKYLNIENLNKAWLTNFSDFSKVEYTKKWTEFGYWNEKMPYMDWMEFWRTHLTWWLTFIHDEIKRIDPDALIHVHSENITDNHAAKSYDFPSWRKLATTLGTSCHVAWAFGFYEKEQFALGMSYVSDVFAGSSREIPYWITELQGGTNYISGGQWPMTPSPEDISQWLWTAIGNGADRVIFWLLNNRLKGFETTEWSMLDLNNKPTDRLLEAGKVAKKIKDENTFFDGANPVKAPITILMSLESMASENWMHREDYDGRGRYAHVKSISGYYEVLLELGLSVNLKYMHDFDWDRKEKGQIAIIPHATVITSDQVEGMKKFITNGNTILMSGLSGLVNEKTEAWAFQGFPFQEFLGATLKEYRLIDDLFSIELQKPSISLQSHLWEGNIENISAEIIGTHEGRVTAIENNYKEGKAIWIPSLLGIGAWKGDNEPLSELLGTITKDATQELPFKFDGKQENCLMKILQNDEKYITIITNGKNKTNTCKLKINSNLKPTVIWGNQSSLTDNLVKLNSLETIVILWE